MVARALTDEQLKEMAELYASGFSHVALAEHFGMHETTVRGWIKRLGVASHHNRKFTNEQVQEMVRRYRAGESTLTLGEAFKSSQQTIANNLQKCGVELRPAGGRRRLSLREDAFDARTPESLYWLGMMATDGCVTGSGGVVDEVKLALKMDDAEHVRSFRTFLGSGHCIGMSINPHPTDVNREIGMCRFAVRSRVLVSSLAKYGIVPRKTQSLVVGGGVENSRDFWRGAMDGDGTVGVYKTNQYESATLKLSSASETFLLQFASFLKVSGVPGSWNVRAESSTGGSVAINTRYVLQLGARFALDAAALLYVDGAPALPRKQRIVAEMLLRGSRGELDGTIREPWMNPQAVAWAESKKVS